MTGGGESWMLRRVPLVVTCDIVAGAGRGQGALDTG